MDGFWVRVRQARLGSVLAVYLGASWPGDGAAPGVWSEGSRGAVERLTFEPVAG